MAKKQAQFRFEEVFYQDIRQLAEEEGLSVSEIVRNSISLYSMLYTRTKGKNVRFYFEDNTDHQNRTEVLLPWLPYKPR